MPRFRQHVVFARTTSRLLVPPPSMGGPGMVQYPGTIQQYSPVGTAPTNGLAIASLVLSLLWLGGLGSNLTIIFGFAARHQIRRSAGRQGGDGLALAGLLVGIWDSWRSSCS